MKTCKDCKNDLPLSEFHSNGKTSSGKRKVKPNCKRCYNKERYAIFIDRLSQMVELKCSACGYDSCIQALEFHHTDPDAKEHRISEMKTASVQRLRAEVKKCLVLCCRCHRELHAEDYTMRRPAQLRRYDHNEWSLVDPQETGWDFHERIFLDLEGNRISGILEGFYGFTGKPEEDINCAIVKNGKLVSKLKVR